MSQMGQNRHCGDFRCMTALPPKAEVHPRSCYVANVPEAAVSNRSKTVALFDHFVGDCQQRRRNCQAQQLGGLEIDNQIELCGLLNR